MIGLHLFDRGIKGKGAVFQSTPRRRGRFFPGEGRSKGIGDTAGTEQLLDI